MDQQTNCVGIATLPTVAMLVLLVIKDYRGFNFRQQMVVLQNQWQLNGGQIEDEMHAYHIYAQDLCIMQQTQRTQLLFMRSHSGKCREKKQRENGNGISRSKEPSVEQLFYVLCAFLWSARH